MSLKLLLLHVHTLYAIQAQGCRQLLEIHND